MLKDSLLTLPQYLLPKHLLTRLVGKLAECKRISVKNWFISKFMQHFKIDLHEAEIENPQEFASFNDFFIRTLKPNARPLNTDPNSVACPADGQVCQIGSISHDQLFQAKAFRFTLSELLGGNQKQAELFQNGEFACFYLAPNAYHRVHMPFTGKLLEMTYIPGQLFSVNRPTTNSVPKLFARNERVVCLFETERGPMAVIMVGAMLVGSIHVAWHGDVTPPRGKKIQTWTYSADNITLEKGAEMGYFKMGSTVLVLFPDNTLTWDSEIMQHASVRVRQQIGMMHGH